MSVLGKKKKKLLLIVLWPLSSTSQAKHLHSLSGVFQWELSRMMGRETIYSWIFELPSCLRNEGGTGYTELEPPFVLFKDLSSIKQTLIA